MNLITLQQVFLHLIDKMQHFIPIIFCDFEKKVLKKIRNVFKNKGLKVKTEKCD